MKPKTKIILSICALCLVTILSVVAIVAVFAADRQTVTSQISVTYKATNVVGTAKGNTIFESVTTPMSGDVSFTYDEASTTKTLTPSAVTLTTDSAETQYCVFEYIFTNGASNSYTATLSLTGGTATNVNVFTNSAGAKISTGWKTAIKDAKTTPTSGNLLSVTVSGNSAGTYAYVLVALNDPLQGATFSGTFSWVLANVTT